MIDILVMSEREMNVVESAIRFVNAAFGLIPADFAVRVGGEKFRKNNLLGISTAHGKRISDHGPLRLAVKTQHFPEIVDEAGENEPARMAVFANCFGGLQQVLDLRQVRIRIA